MHNERMAQLIARKLSGEASPEEIKELDILLQEHPADAYFLSLLADYWSTPVIPATEEDQDAEAHFRHVLNTAHNEMQEEPETGSTSYSRSRYPIRRLISVAAAVTALVLLSWWWVKQYRQAHHAPLATRIETIAKPGAKSRLLLPDGSIVFLNSGSRISYPANFTDSIREVVLEGEAYFDVAKDPGRPFLVRTSDINIKVLGTAFNVKCYPEDHKTEATLIRGLVQISRNSDNGQVLLLHPHEKVVINRLPESIAANTDTPPPMAAPDSMTVKYLKKNAADTAMAETAWVYNKLVFDGENFREISDEMERWFNVKIIFHDPVVAGYRFHAKFENEHIKDVLSALRLSLPFTFKIENNEVNIYR
jgi:transmembrane sensor